MKSTIIPLFLTLVFTSCVPHSAFGEFDFTQEQQQWENNRVNSEIQNEKSIAGTVTAVYLNKVFPQEYKGDEYFLVALYLKNKSLPLSMSLNEEEPLEQKQLPKDSALLKFVKDHKEWMRYMLVRFKERKEEDVLKLTVKAGEYRSATLIFKKDE